jgi:hypothetical protein
VTQEAGRDDLSELAALLQEIRVTWRPLDDAGRNQLRRMVIEAVYRFRAGQQPAAGPPEACPWDVSGLVDAPRETLLSLLRDALFDREQLSAQLAARSAGIAAQQADDRARLARVWKLVDHRRRTVPMADLKMALSPEMYAEPVKEG